MGAVSQEITRRTVLTGELSVGQSLDVQTLAVADWFGWEMTCVFYFVDKSKTKMLKSIATVENGQVKDSVFAKVGSLKVSVETKMVGSDVVFSIENADNQNVFYRITQNNY